MQLFRRQDLAQFLARCTSSTAWQLLHRFIERRVQDACESLMWAGSIFAKRLTQQGVALTTGALTVALPHKAASTAAAVGVTLTAAFAFAPPIEGSPPSQTGAAKLPAVVEQALKENAQQLTPISVSSTTQMKTTLSPTETFGQLKDQGTHRSDRFFSVQHSRVVWQGNKVRSSIKSLVGTNGDQQATSQSDVVYDGAAQVALMGSTYKRRKSGAPST